MLSATILSLSFTISIVPSTVCWTSAATPELAWAPAVAQPEQLRAVADEYLDELARKMEEVGRRLADAKARGAEREAAELQRAIAELEHAAAQHKVELARDDDARAQAGQDEAKKALHEIEVAMVEARRRFEEAHARGDEGATREWAVHLEQLEQEAARLRNALRESGAASDRRPESVKRPEGEGDLMAAQERIVRLEQAERALREAGMHDMASAVCLERIAFAERVEREVAARTERDPAREDTKRDETAVRHEQVMARIERLEAAMAELSAHVRRLHELVESMRPRSEESRQAR